ncbi:hypothetical protein ASPZODRAFT_696556 [Penicilliopsis zonata CBS 506.65]|uniref:Carboxylic ester hydrolase n=1 Tax=Penicilliopsis zonata CBS 506.65 TaxID=1073090 RepID=A0A1L9SBT2_9EURO|nr:hypothetical protein ASPZODRAFT_696556 [Penicilliopsis zonata CBS 506.65]OJJ44589.1 hypothetical protein ASPZODRAFT_696556 [Penicilliopsis zonata CBS 506.65]
MGSISTPPADNPAVVILETTAGEQKIVGRPSPSFPSLVQEFRGIPYGTVPGRWRHSTLRTSLPSDDFDATKNGPQCPQPAVFANSETYQSYLPWPTDVGESEFECLNLFIVRPSPSALERAGLDAKNARLPVYFMIHGGGWGFGAGTDPMWDPTRLVARSVEQGKPFIAVTINYRLGIFGFGVSSDIIAAQPHEDVLKGGNFGLGDQRIALRWVSQNISAFGGDPAKITIAGQSAGSMSVQCHVLEAKFGTQPPLFRRAIMQSGGLGGLGPTSIEQLDGKWEKLYQVLDIPAASKEEKVQALLQLSDSDLLAACAKLQWIVFPAATDGLTIHDRPGGRWWVHLGRGEEPRSPESVLQEPIAVYIGDCEEEGFLRSQIAHVKSFSHLESLLTSLSPPVARSVIEELLSQYEITPTTPLPDIHKRMFQLATDYQFGSPVHAARKELSLVASDQIRPLDGSKVFPIEVRSFRVQTGNPFPGVNRNFAHHCVDLLYIYDCFYVDMDKTDKLEESTGTRPQGWASNRSLVADFQRNWTDFIVDESVNGSEEIATVYGVDRKTHQKRTTEDPEWIRMTERFEVVQRNFEDVELICNTLRSLSASHFG